MTTTYMAPHETYELHELLTFNTLCMTKATTMNALTQDSELKSLLSQDATNKQQAITRLRQFITDKGGQS
ncbi:MAG TPA: hypothetical protein VEY51_04355 [Chondromyces sp.]|nr:hypothetical protein [Chondromyces sp.]